jgi:hypothetical protein
MDEKRFWGSAYIGYYTKHPWNIQYTVRGSCIVNCSPTKGVQVILRSDILSDTREAMNMQSSMNKEQLKDVIKTALVEVLEERQDLFHEAIEVALEDIALARAIKEGEKARFVRREEVFRILEGKV